MRLSISEKFHRSWDNNLLLFISILIYLILEIPKQITELNSLRTIQALFLSIVVFGHGVKRSGWGAILFLMLITFGISWTTESVSILRGIPFGHYYYTEHLGTKIGNVPWGIMPAYFLTGYLSWSLSTSFLNSYGRSIKRRDLFITPLIAGFIMVMWDFCFDPIHATVMRSWVWENGGAFWGVPVSNFFGWFFTVYLIFQIYAIYLYFRVREEAVDQNRFFWFIPPIMYLALALEFLLNPFFKTENLDLYWSMFLGTIFTMFFTGLLNVIIVSRRQQ